MLMLVSIQKQLVVVVFLKHKMAAAISGAKSDQRLLHLCDIMVRWLRISDLQSFLACWPFFSQHRPCLYLIHLYLSRLGFLCPERFPKHGPG